MRKDFIYTQTRLQARHGMRPDERTWGLVESQKDLANFLQSARHSSLNQWLSGLQASDSHHFIESTLLKHYCDYVNEVAAWVPAEWCKSVRWIICLTYLPVIQHLLAGNTAYSWMLEDPRIKMAATTNIEQRMNYLSQSEFSPLFKYWKPGVPMLEAWLEHWKILWPEKTTRRNQSFTSFINILNRHRELFGQLPVDRTWRQRQNLVFKLTMMFRRLAYDPVNVFVHLLLVAIDVERLRAAVIQRHLFDKYWEEAS